MVTLISRFVKDDGGATAIEYGLICALVSVAAIAALAAMGQSLESLFNLVSSALTSAVNAGG